MRWKNLRRSRNVDDRRGRSGGSNPLGGLLGGLLRGKMGIGVIVVVIAISYFTGTNPLTLLQTLSGGSSGPASSTQTAPAANDEQSEFVRSILGSTEDVWGAIFQSAGTNYRAPTLVLFTGQVQSACGFNTAATGPFYCPGDEQVYIDLSFFSQLSRMGAPGDFAQAYVIGHEVGHHLQNITGTERQMRQAQRAAGSTSERNLLSVAMELQADCYAGVWAHHANRQHRVLEPGDVEEGLRAARQIGDDTLQRSAGKKVVKESFTHGSSAQRMNWLQRGLETGDVNQCDTFGQIQNL